MSYRFLCTVIRSAAVLVCLSGSAQAGLIEICKDASLAGSLSGLSTFTIAGQPGTVAVLVGACSPAIQLPNGFATITELPQADMTLIGVSTFPGDRLISFDATTQSAVVLIVAGDISTQTVITFTNSPVTGVPETATGWLAGLGLTFWACSATRKKVAGAARGVFLSSARRMKRWCGGGDLNPYEIAPASTSS